MTLLTTAEAVAALVQSRVAAISIANGFETDIGTKVFRGKRSIEERDYPCTIIAEGADTNKDQQPTSAAVRVSQAYVLQSYLPCDPNNPNDAAHQALRDLKRAIFRGANGRGDSRMGNAVQNVEYRGRDIAPRVDGGGFVAAAIEIAITFSEDLANP